MLGATFDADGWAPAGEVEKADTMAVLVSIARDRGRVRMRDRCLRPWPRAARRIGAALREKLLRDLQYDGPGPAGECVAAGHVDVFRQPRD